MMPTKGIANHTSEHAYSREKIRKTVVIHDHRSETDHGSVESQNHSFHDHSPKLASWL
jgi:hypothetical protein